MNPGWLSTDMGRQGGRTPPVSVEDGVKNVVAFLYSLQEKHNGGFYDNLGKDLPW